MTLRSSLFGLMVITMISILCLSLTSVPSQAQERRTLFQFLFGGGREQMRQSDDFPEPPVRTRKPPRVRKQPADAGSVVPLTTPAPPTTKLENAKKILVVGDFLATGLSEGLRQAFETAPGVVVEGRANISSGLVRNDYYDWQAELPRMIDEIKPSLVVVLIGANDRQQMQLGEIKEKFRTDAWLAAYEARTLSMARSVTSRGLPLIWVGLPAFQSPSMTTDAAQLNGIFRRQMEAAGGEFIDVWDGFVDENGRFVITGSDINGQQVRLRGSDGLNFTKAGRRKIAFYVEKPARRLLGDVTVPDLTRLDSSDLPGLVSRLPKQEESILRIKPISLTDPELDGGAELLGAGKMPIGPARTARDLLIEKGEIAPPPTGRIDDYRMTKPETADKAPTASN